NNLVFPLFHSMYNTNIRQPIGGEYGFSEWMVDVLLRDPSVLLTNKATWGTDNWFVSQALANEAKILQVNLGIKKHNESDKKHMIDGEEVDALSLMFIEVADVVFSEIGDNIAAARADKENYTKIITGDEIEKVSPKEVKMDFRKNIDSFKKAFSLEANREVYREVLGETIFGRLEELSRADADDFALPSELWADIVHLFVLAYHFSPGLGKDRLLRSLMWLYKARAGSFGGWLREFDAAAEKAEELFWHQAGVFRLRKADFLKRWDEASRGESPRAAPDSSAGEAPGPAVHTEMVKRLIKGGLSLNVLVTDIRELREPNAREAIEAAGWKKETLKNGTVAYSMGRSHLFGLGQRAVFFRNGEYALVAFAGSFMQTILMDATGKITSSAVTRRGLSGFQRSGLLRLLGVIQG
ncbi:hypothetical protein ACFL2T_04625, partial [Elusimicrobiota bacterium]